MRPLLMNFVTTREDCGEEFELKYDEEKDRNEIVRKSSIVNSSTLLSSTVTRVKVEKPDFAPIFDGPQALEYLAAKTITEVKAEKPDVFSDVKLVEFMASKTFTKAKGEGPDWQ